MISNISAYHSKELQATQANSPSIETVKEKEITMNSNLDTVTISPKGMELAAASAGGNNGNGGTGGSGGGNGSGNEPPG